MSQFHQSLIPMIESFYDNFTAVEKEIADFFIHNEENMDFSSKSISTHLYVSEASLSRFAKKCGFKGYREFIYRYQDMFQVGKAMVNHQTKSVLDSYQELLTKSYNLFDEAQLRRIIHMMNEKQRVYIYGIGSSGLAASEFRNRFMRIGLDVEAITDAHIMKMNAVRLNNEHLVIGVSIRGTTEPVISSLRSAKERGAYTVLITSKRHPEFNEFIDDVLLVAVLKNLAHGNVISPQFPVLIMMDILYEYYIQSNKSEKEALHDYTLNALEEKAPHN